MCSNYRAVTRSDRMLTFFGIERAKDEDPVDVWPTGLAPFIRLAEPGSGNKLVVEEGLFGLLPAFQKEMAAGRKTYNARTETVAKLPSYRDSWRNGLRCIIPAESIYELNYESGKAVRWSIQLAGGIPMGIAGIYSRWEDPATGIQRFTFSMLTVNADEHIFMKRFHAPDDEKRMVVILHPREYDDWLACPVQEASRFFMAWQGALEGWAAALPPRAANFKKSVGAKLPLPPQTGNLF
jgi:putative SOS response-associated peptidase YedK